MRILGLLILSACSLPRFIDRQTLQTMAPSTLAGEDVGASCATGLALGPVVASLGPTVGPDRVRIRPEKSIAFTRLAAGMCSDEAVWAAELDRTRAVFEGRGGLAADLLIVEQRLHEEAGLRYLDAWRALEAAYAPAVLGESCPALPTEGDELLFLLGLTSGALATVHDRAALGSVGAPGDLPRRVEQAAGCVDDQRWWGAPNALRAAVWAIVPGAAPEGVDPWAALAQAAATGDAQGVRLGRALQVQTLVSAGKLDLAQEAIAAHGASLAGQPGPERAAYAMIDRFATRLIQHESDKIWMARVGHRTPHGSLGRLPAPPAGAANAATEDDGLEQLLRSVLDATSVEPSSPPAAPEEAP